MDKRRRKAGGVTAKRSERKRQWGAKAFTIVLFMAAGAVGGYLIGHAMSGGETIRSDTVAWLVAAVALLVVACILQVVVHEAGHLVLGLATGYRFRSFRVGSLMLVEQDGRLSLKRLSIQGTGGQCLMGPPDLVDGRIPYRLYNLGGVLANTLVSLVAAALAFALPQRLAAIFFAFLALVGLAFALTNGLPLTVGGVNNDGKNLRSAGESPDALRAFWTILKVGEAQADDLRVKDMPAAWFAVPADAERLRNPLIASVAVLACNRLLDEGRTSRGRRRHSRPAGTRDRHARPASLAVEGGPRVLRAHGREPRRGSRARPRRRRPQAHEGHEPASPPCCARATPKRSSPTATRKRRGAFARSSTAQRRATPTRARSRASAS